MLECWGVDKRRQAVIQYSNLKSLIGIFLVTDPNIFKVEKVRKTMLTREDIRHDQIAIYDADRKGIFIHKDQLLDSAFKVGDRFAIKKGQKELFALVIVKDEDGEIVFDKTGIFIARSRRVDVFMGGIFDEYVIFFELDKADTFKIKPLEMVLKGNRL